MASYLIKHRNSFTFTLHAMLCRTSKCSKNLSIYNITNIVTLSKTVYVMFALRIRTP